MQLSELIDKEGIEAVSQKTNISIENLKILNNKDFENLNRVKSLGFLNILEREYGIEVDTLKESIKEYFEEHHTAEDDEVIVLAKQHTDGGSGSGLLKWLIIAALLYGGWYLYNTGKMDSVSSRVEGNENTLEDTTALKSNVSEEKAQSVVIKTQSSEEKVAVEATSTESGSDTKEVEVAVSKVEKVVEINTSAVEEKASEVEVVKEETATIESVSSSIEVNSSVETTEAIAEGNSSDDANASTVIENLTINPTRGMLWYGFINIDTKEKREFMNKVSTPFELNGGRWILTTGHGFVDIVSEIKTVEVADRV
ncbi:MAG: hypothetical protein K0U38_09015, partial [Epsilonproteobacteria bacterium]|nr:hypothetical protein [Campylobacterota bacterium]